MFATIFVTGQVSFGRYLPKKDLTKSPATVEHIGRKPNSRTVRSSITCAMRGGICVIDGAGMRLGAHAHGCSSHRATVLRRRSTKRIGHGYVSASGLDVIEGVAGQPWSWRVDRAHGCERRSPGVGTPARCARSRQGTWAGWCSTSKCGTRPCAPDRRAGRRVPSNALLDDPLLKSALMAPLVSCSSSPMECCPSTAAAGIHGDGGPSTGRAT